MTNPPPDNDALALAIVEHLGPSALAGDKMTPLHAFELGWQAAKDSPIPTQVGAESVDTPEFRAKLQAWWGVSGAFESRARQEIIAHIDSLVAAARQEGQQDGRKARDVAAGIATGLIEHYKARAEKAEATLAASQAAPAKAEGWQIVPTEPTPEMVQACDVQWMPRIALPFFVAAYKTMLAAAPSTLPEKNT